MAETKFPTQMVTLPSKSWFYDSANPLSSGEVEVKYMTAKEEDILTSQNLIKKGVVFDKLLDALVVSKIKLDDMLIGDKNAVLIAARVLAYGKNYEFDYIDPLTGEKAKFTSKNMIVESYKSKNVVNGKVLYSDNNRLDANNVLLNSFKTLLGYYGLLNDFKK